MAESRSRPHRSDGHRTRHSEAAHDADEDHIHPDRRARASRQSRSRSRSRTPPPRPRPSRFSPPHSHGHSHSHSHSHGHTHSRSQLDQFNPQPPPPKELPNFKPTGLLAKEANTIAGTDVVLKYHEPSDAATPARADWRLFSFGSKTNSNSQSTGSEHDGDGGDDDREDIPPVTLSARSSWLFGTERRAVAVVLTHHSVDDQHAVIQFRRRARPSANKNDDDDGYDDSKTVSQIKPYLVDLESERGTRLNGKKIPPGRFVELRKGDVVQFGRDKREWVLVRNDNAPEER